MPSTPPNTPPNTTPTAPTPGSSTPPSPKTIGDKFKKNDAHNEHLQINDPDAVQKGIIDVWGWAEDNIKWLVGAAVLLLIAGIAHVVTHAYWDHQERVAQEAYYAAEAKFTKTKEAFDKAKMKAFMPQPKTGEKEDEAKAATGDLAKDYGTTIADLEKVAHDYNATAAGAQAAILSAQTYLQYKQPDKAIELAELPIKGLGNSHMLSQLARVLWGTALSEKGNCQEAVKVWQEVLDNKNASYLHGEVGLRSGICYETLNQADKAAEMYRKVSAESGESPSAQTAKGLLRALEIKGKTAAPQPAPQKG